MSLPNFDWEVHVGLGSAGDSGDLVIRVQAPKVEDALVLALAKFRETHKDLEHNNWRVHIQVTNLTIWKAIRNSGKTGV